MSQNSTNVTKNKTSVQYITITSEEEDQRIDNFLITRLKGMPKSHIYRLLRKGEVRVNKKRIDADYRLCVGDIVRLPPVYLPEKAQLAPPSKQTTQLLTERIIYEDENFIILNKPSGMSVHAGNTVRVGVIEALKMHYPQYPNLELGHRLDSDTSGCLVIAKRKRILREFHQLLREGKVTKIYWTLTAGKWKRSELMVDVALTKQYRSGGKHVVETDDEGKDAKTHFKPIKQYSQAGLMEVRLYTGRTHQIRVHAAHREHPIAGDDRYGTAEFNRQMQSYGLRRLFLHAHSLDFILPSLDQRIRVEAPLDKELQAVLDKLEAGEANSPKTK